MTPDTDLNDTQRRGQNLSPPPSSPVFTKSMVGAYGDEKAVQAVGPSISFNNTGENNVSCLFINASLSEQAPATFEQTRGLGQQGVRRETVIFVYS